MDINELRGLSIVFTMIAFLSIVFWAYSSKRKKKFDEAANLPFEDEALHKKTQARNGDDT